MTNKTGFQLLSPQISNLLYYYQEKDESIFYQVEICGLSEN